MLLAFTPMPCLTAYTCVGLVDDCTEKIEDNAIQDWLFMQGLCDGQNTCIIPVQGANVQTCFEPYVADYKLVFYKCFPGMARIAEYMYISNIADESTFVVSSSIFIITLFTTVNIMYFNMNVLSFFNHYCRGLGGTDRIHGIRQRQPHLQQWLNIGL